MAISKELIKEALSEIRLKKSQERRKHIERKIDFYTGTNMGDYTKQWFNQDSFGEIPPYELNITAKLIDKKSRLYTIGANRKSNKVYESLTRFKNKDFKQIERMTNLIGTIATLVSVKEDADGPYFCYYPIYYFDPFFDDSDPLNPTAIIYPLLDTVNDINNINDLEYVYIDDTDFMRIHSSGDVLEHISHNLGVLPVLFTHRNPQVDEFYVEGANDIINCNLHVNITMTELQLGLRYQMFGQPYVSGFHEFTNLQRVGSDVTLTIPEGSKYDIVSPQGKVLDAIESIKFQIELVAQSNHLHVTWAQDGGEVPSGISLVIKDFDRLEDYQDDIELYTLYELKAFEIEKALADTWNLSIPKKISIEFLKPDYPKPVNEQILEDEFDLKYNLTSLPKILMRKHQNNITLDEAKSIIEDNIKDNEGLLNAENIDTEVSGNIEGDGTPSEEDEGHSSEGVA